MKDKTSVQTQDPSKLDKKIPRDLIIQYQGTHYILKAGLEWKANELFGGAGYSIHMQEILMDHEKNHYIFKATLVVLENGVRYENYGEAKIANANSMMKNQLLHLAVTRAECRVLRMATACGYASYDEVRTTDEDKKTPVIVNGSKPASEAQIKTVKALGGEAEDGITRQEASDLINSLSK